MFGFLRSTPYRDATLGEFTRKSGRWRGRIVIPPHGDVELRVAGGRGSPDAASMEMARSLAVTYQALQTEITRALFEHYQPGREAWTSGELEGMVDSFPEITNARDVWSHIQVQHVDIDAARSDFPVEVRIDAAWDDEHTLGVRLRDGRVVELCGSVGP